MSAIKLKSENPKMSWVISKNPASGGMAKGVRLGVSFGWFTPGDESEYNIYFKDADDEVSFKSFRDEKFEYLNMTRFNSALFVVGSIDEFFRSAYKSIEENDVSDKYENSFFINMIEVKNDRYLTSFNKFFKDYEIEYENTIANNYRVTIKTRKSIHELLNFASLFAIFNAIVNEEPIFVKPDVVSKYLKSLNVVDAPYFIRYLFKLRFIKSDSQLAKFKELLEKTDRADINMVYGDTWIARQRSIEDRLSFHRDIIDIGCGEGRYLSRLASKIREINYHAIDIDEEELEKAKKKARNKNLDVQFYNSVAEFIDKGVDSEFDVILTEVIEHMPLEDARQLVADILDIKGVKRLIVTTPDVRFNSNYFDGEEMRHDDHDFEIDRDDFEAFINESINLSGVGVDNCEAEWFAIGDNVDGITPSQGTTIEIKK